MIGTTAAILGAAAIGTAGSLAAGAMQSNAANKAAQVQAQAADSATAVQRDALDFQKQTFEQNRTDALPWMQTGLEALNQYKVELGLADGQSKFQATPGYDFAVQEGEKGVLSNLSALGMKGSGAALKALTSFREGLANQEFGNYLGRLGGLASGGQSQVNANASLGANTAASLTSGATSLGNTMQNAAAARASGYAGSANAWSNAIGGATNNVGNALGMMSYLPRTNALGAYPAAPTGGMGGLSGLI